MKKNPNKLLYSKAEIVKTLGLRRVSRYSDGRRVWISAAGKEYASLSAAAVDMPKKDGDK